MRQTRQYSRVTDKLGILKGKNRRFVARISDSVERCLIKQRGQPGEVETSQH